MRAHDGPAMVARWSGTIQPCDTCNVAVAVPRHDALCVLLPAAVVSPASGKYCITAGYDRTVKLWNPHREDPDGGGPLLIQTFKGPHGHPVHDVCMCVGCCRIAVRQWYRVRGVGARDCRGIATRLAVCTNRCCHVASRMCLSRWCCRSHDDARFASCGEDKVCTTLTSLGVVRAEAADLGAPPAGRVRLGRRTESSRSQVLRAHSGQCCACGACVRARVRA
jgi:hypothetical protein